ncbi:hypothetical protein HpBGD107_09520 [Helicobacter pylori]
MFKGLFFIKWLKFKKGLKESFRACLLYTSDAADEEDSVDLGGRRIIKKKKKKTKQKKKTNKSKKKREKKSIVSEKKQRSNEIQT